MRRLILIGQFPPPINGLAMVNNYVYERLVKSQDLNIVKINTAPRTIINSVQNKLYRLYMFFLSVLIFSAYALKGRSTVYIGLSNGFGLYYEMVFVVVARLLRSHVILHLHSSNYLENFFYRFHLMGILLNRGLLIVPHDSVASRIRSVYYGWRPGLVALSNSTFVKPRSESVCIKKSIKKIGFFANIETSKGIFCFLDMAKIYYDNNIEVEFIVAGEFRDESVKLEVLRFVDGLNNIQFISVLSDHQRDIFYREIDLLVVTSYSESDPMIVHEAMSWGVVVISRDVGVVKSIVKNNESGMVLHFSSIAEDFAKAASKISYEYKMQSFSENSILLHRKSYSANVAKFNQVFELNSL